MPDVQQDGRVGEKRSLFARHKKWLTFIGALIVFVAFIYNEGVREELKDRSDTLNTAGNNFVTRTDTDQLSTYMAYVNYRVGRVTPVPSRPGENAEISLQTMRDTVDLMLATVSRIEAADGNLRRFREALEPNALFDDNVSRIKLVVQSEREHNDIVWRKAKEENWASPHDPQNIRQIVLKADEVTKECNDLRHDQIEPLEKGMLAEANSERTASGEKLEASKKVSYCLFALGWLLGLVGKLSETGTIADDD
ncbi:MAG TPA: hypothetical protein VEO19_09165 [Terriglobia bacterium]|nr:hypothetical protein [Terriglobia bacterium]